MFLHSRQKSGTRSPQLRLSTELREATLVEFLDAQRAFNDTIQSYNDARADYARSLYQLDSVSGEAVNR